MEQPEEYITATEAWQRMGVSNSTLARMIANGEVPVFPHPRHKQMKMIPVSFVDQWNKEHGPPLKRRKKKPQEVGTEGATNHDQAA